MTRPVRMRLSRAAGFDLQAASRALNGLPAVNVARPGPLGNPFVSGRRGTRAACAAYHALLMIGVTALHARRRNVMRALPQLKGRNLACWCALDGKPCHADNLLILANEAPPFTAERLMPWAEEVFPDSAATLAALQALAED